MKRRARVLVALVQQTIREFGADDGPWLAAAMSYYVAFALFPLVLVIVAGFGLLLQVSPRAQDAQGTLLAIIARSESPAVAHAIDQVLAGIKAQAGVGGPLGLLGVLFGAVGILAALDSAFDRLWNIPPPQTNGFVEMARLVLGLRLKAFIMLLILGALLVIAFFGGLALSAIGTWANAVPLVRFWWQSAQIAIGVVVNTLLLAAIYRFLPRAPVHWRDALFGGVLAAVIWEIGKLLLASVVIGQHYSAYGVVGAFIALMAWIFYASTIFFVCAEFVQVLCERRAAAAPDTVAQCVGPQHLMETESRR
jgi:membrane protein